MSKVDVSLVRVRQMSALLLLVGISGCGVSVKDDWYSYQRAVRPEVAQMQSVVDATQNLDKEGDTAHAVRVLRTEVLPRLHDLDGRLAAIRPQTAPVRKVADEYLAYIQGFADGVGDLADAMEHGNYQKAEEADRTMKKASEKLSAFNADVRSLTEEYGRAP
jgi:hypothetical protein